jgi:hydroxyethylthiazole kinase-like uncharacterized protein yjeF
VRVVDIGLDTRAARAHVVEASDVRGWVPRRAPDTHKWRGAVWVVAGSPGMTGAAYLASAAAMRAGSGYVRLSTPGGGDDPGAPTEVVRVPIGEDLSFPAEELARFGAMVLGPGLGRDRAVTDAVRRVVGALPLPLVIDGDALRALGDAAPGILATRTAPTVVTPHDAEFHGLGGASGGDRFDAVRALSARLRVVVLLKGPTTLVAEPAGRVLVSTAGDARLATAGTGDVLSGIIGALLARGVSAFEAAAAGAFLHGSAAAFGPAEGLVASDLLVELPRALRLVREA